MKRKYPTILWPILAVVWVAFCFSTLLTAQNSATNSDNNQVVADQLRQMQQQLNEQQQQINRLQGELKEARGQVKLVNGGTQPELVPIGYSEPASGEPAAAVAVAPDAPPPGPTVIPAVVPLRVLPFDSPKTGGVLGLKVGPITLQPYGFIKSTAARDSSNPDGDDFPFAFGIWVNAANSLSTGVTSDSEFHVKARSTRFGMNIEWPDFSPKLTMTGRIEGDFEGNFNESNNSDVTSAISNNPRIRLAFVRLDYHASENTSFYFEGGQDWTLFGSGVQVELLETTGNAGYYGDARGRAPQLRAGWIQTLSHERNVKFLLEGGITMPGTGSIPKLGVLDTGCCGSTDLVAPPDGGEGLAVQLGEGDREGEDSGRPEVEGRIALQFQLDNAKGVAPAQISLAGFQGRSEYVPIGDLTTGAGLTAGDRAALAGKNPSSVMYGGQIGVQLPTRWATFTASLYRGANLRFYAAGQVNTFATMNCPTTGTFTVTHSLLTQDGSPGVQGPANVCVNEGDTNGFVAPELPIRSFGGFAQVGFPLSRIFNADPKGRNAGWRLLLSAGKDQVVDRDLQRFSGLGGALTTGSGAIPLAMGKFAALGVFYKLNQWANFAFEESIYASRLVFGDKIYAIAGFPANEWQDHRTEFGPIFTF